MLEIDSIPINIWDDYHEDGYVPDGENQNTYAYVEDYDLLSEIAKHALERLYNYIVANKLLPNVQMSLIYYKSKDKYPTLDDIYQYERWELRFENLTHKLREELVEKLNKNKIYDDCLLRIYSES